jgi:anaerobic dimethyl sulfoxide reductase subunit B (iron-sulfur subunit)
MAQLGFYFNADWCVGCRTCQITCKEIKGLDVGILYRHVRDFETGAFPSAGYYHISSTCNHCAVPACMAVCPEVAISKDDETGIVAIDQELCIGCKICIDACPYTVPQFFADAVKVNKCDFCQDLLARGENPVCVDSCPQFALEYGDMDELAAKYADAVKDLPAIPSSNMTDPSSIITPRAAALESDFREKQI